MAGWAAFLCGCETPASIAGFSSSAMDTLQSGNMVFDDMKRSCVREVQSRDSFGTFAVVDRDPPDCEAIGKQAEGLKAVSKVLLDYYGALNDLASFGSGKVAGDVTGLAARGADLAKLTKGAQESLNSLANFVATAAASGYQRKHLRDDIVRANGNINNVLSGLVESVNGPYLDLLSDEQKKVANRYKEFLLQHRDSPETILALDARWQNDSLVFASKRSAALSYVAALEILSKGNEELAAHSGSLKGKELAGILSPYCTQLESLVRAAQKAF
jgi:hypothetical protein